MSKRIRKRLKRQARRQNLAHANVANRISTKLAVGTAATSVALILSLGGVP